MVLSCFFVCDRDSPKVAIAFNHFHSQMLPRGRAYRYPSGRNMPEVPVPGAMLPGYDMGGVTLREAGIAQPLPITTLASALANASPEQQRTVGYL